MNKSHEVALLSFLVPMYIISAAAVFSAGNMKDPPTKHRFPAPAKLVQNAPTSVLRLFFPGSITVLIN